MYGVGQKVIVMQHCNAMMSVIFIGLAEDVESVDNTNVSS